MKLKRCCPRCLIRMGGVRRYGVDKTYTSGQMAGQMGSDTINFWRGGKWSLTPFVPPYFSSWGVGLNRQLTDSAGAGKVFAIYSESPSDFQSRLERLACLVLFSA